MRAKSAENLEMMDEPVRQVHNFNDMTHAERAVFLRCVAEVYRSLLFFSYFCSSLLIPLLLLFSNS
jgi:hypothetical protein